ncbi:queuine tRNA-ribosyltransferase accessory subunit 2 [Aethina tumida]|uniref:queuine tRNA-ribosyltransferase accessory subunit 2 n=1 Tax=Aethina tumida TaxID=116153 RepID=UPI00096B021A|nr:queuine tRNA-ribosyltransferase accessory subunit 2 [Aethina tumida]
MKFTVQNVSRLRPRIGVLSNLNDRPEVNLETPMLLLHSQGGQIPHVTHEVFKLVSQDAYVLQIPLQSVHNFQETMQHYRGSISEFVGSKNSFSCITFQDPSQMTKHGHHLKTKVPLWTKNGLVHYDPTMYMKMMESVKPDMYIFLSDGDTNKASHQKRITKSVDTTIDFYKQCLEYHRKSEVLQRSFPMACITGGYDLKARERCLETVCKDPDIQGYLIDGLHNNGPEIEFLPFLELKPIVELIMKTIPESKLTCIQGCWNPVNIIKFVQLGVDLFDTSYCKIVTERAAALTFSMDLEGEVEEYEINLRDRLYSDDFMPILRHCTCMSCKNYSRAYIHHLLTVQELLGPILIMVHNIHHYLRFFQQIRQCVKEDKLNDLELIVAKQFKNYEDSMMKREELAEAS